MADHNEVNVDAGMGYEENTVDVRLILYFTGGLFLLIVITFVLMWAFQYHLLAPAWDAADKRDAMPMALNAEERLPPEPRLQSAPGFGVDTAKGRISLQLREPQAEYRILWKEWQKEWKDGTKDPQTGTVISLPIEEAKEKVLKEGLIKSRTNEENKQALKNADTLYSASSSGRMQSEVRR